jgi:hypothetical protein
MKDYFDVNNKYVLHKLRIILFPVTIKVVYESLNWGYRVKDGKGKTQDMISIMKSSLLKVIYKLLTYTFL